MSSSTTLIDSLRAAIAKSGKTQIELQAASGVPQSRISAFVRGGSMRLEHAGRLATALGLKLVVARGRKA